VRIWDQDTGRTRHTFAGHTSNVRALTVSPDGTWLASTGRDGTVRIWHIRAERPVTALRTGHALSHVVTDGQWIAAAGDRGPYIPAIAGTDACP
jgi:WD40 repeat protein